MKRDMDVASVSKPISRGWAAQATRHRSGLHNGRTAARPQAASGRRASGIQNVVVMYVVDANVVKSGLLSRRGASNAILLGMLQGTIPFAASTAIILEYEDVLMREGGRSVLPLIGRAGVTEILDALCRSCRRTPIFFRFRPFLSDAKDDLYIECALASGSDTIVTFDSHFDHRDLAAFGLRKAVPKDILIALSRVRKSS